MFIRFDVIYERDRQTDGQTDRRTPHDSKDRACIASRGKMNKHIFECNVKYANANTCLFKKNIELMQQIL